MSNKTKNDSGFNIDVGHVINYNFLYSNEEEKIGLVIDIKKDRNFYAMIYVLANNEIDVIPYNIITYKVI